MQTLEPTRDRTAGVSRSHAAVAGLLAALAALAGTELLAGLVDAVPSLVTVVGDSVIDLAPPALKDFAVAVFGTADKLALQVGTVLLSAAAGAAIGVLAARRFVVGVLGFVLFALLGAVATFADPQAGLLAGAIGGLVGAAVGLATLRTLLHSARGTATEEPGREASGDRRAFLRTAVLVGGATVAAGWGGRELLASGGPLTGGELAQLPESARGAPTAPDAATVDVQDMTPLYTPNGNFYRIDTALRAPRADMATWALSVGGLVDRPFSLSYDELMAEADTEADITMACVSNEVGGGLVGNARWFGVPLARLLERAGVQDAGEQVVGVSLDGFTVGFPTPIALDGRMAMVAVGMNGEALPLAHGFPARLVVPGLYGYVSATKWLSEIRLDRQSFDAYWVPRGWAKEGPIKTQSRIDVPRPGAQVSAGTVPLAGVAWAPHRGISRVEVSVDDGEWQEAELAEALDVNTWRQWVLRWRAEPGSHRIQVRATDDAGETQIAEENPPRPDGATGYHTITLDVA